MKGALPSVGLGSLSTIFTYMTTSNVIEAVIVGFIGGAAGYIGKLLIELIVKQIKKLVKKA